ncbi:MAG: hypothetical protein U9O24_07900 [Campylobacterota bacterium]|nr:hypothetical protein [Campylobacterota bacterium]
MARKFTEPVVRKRVEEDTDNEYSLLSLESIGKLCEKTGKRKKREMTLKHNACGHIWILDIYEFMEGKRRCGKCKGKVLQDQNAEDIEVIKKKTEALTDGEYSFVDSHYKNSKTKHDFKHNTCGTIFKKKWEKFKGTPKQPGQRCTECYRKGMESVASRYTRDVLDHLQVEYVCEQRFDDCRNPKTGKLLPFDYYLPEINTLIEIDGEQHERGSFTKYDHIGTVERDKVKNNYAEKKGIELVRIPAKKWSELPEFLYAILSKKLIPTLTLEEVKGIAHSTHPERINKDLKQIHDGEYQLHDNYYFGVDRDHNFIHQTCGTVFSHTVYRIKTEKYPCPTCRGENLKRDKHDESNKKLIKISKGRYTLDDSQIGLDKKGRRLTRCNKCNKSWLVTVGNLMGNKAGCQNCLELKKDKEWKLKYDLVLQSLQNGIKLDKKLSNWVWQNKRKYIEGKLKVDRINLLNKHDLNLL